MRKTILVTSISAANKRREENNCSKRKHYYTSAAFGQNEIKIKYTEVHESIPIHAISKHHTAHAQTSVFLRQKGIREVIISVKVTVVIDLNPIKLTQFMPNSNCTYYV